MALVRRYKLASMDFFSDLTLAPRMMLRGKLKLKAHKIKGRKEIGRIFELCRRQEAP
jgi:hypothetical protein